MKIETNIDNILNLMDRPAFCVRDGIIQGANQAALNRMICVGIPVDSLISSGADDYRIFRSGSLCLTLTLCGREQPATVTRMEDTDIFLMEHNVQDPQLRAFALAAQALRMPLSQVLSISDQILPWISGEDHPSAAEQVARLNRGLYQILRLVGNMSDAANAGAARMELRDVTAVVREILDHAIPLFQEADVTISFTNHPVPIHSLIDSQKLERAVYNLLSNALKHTGPGGVIQVLLRRSGSAYHLIVTDSGSCDPSPHAPGVFDRFTREPGIEDSHDGLGLGLALVRAVALAHHGTLLLAPHKNGGTQAQLSLPIRQDTRELRSPTVRIDYAGERDHGLIELADALPHTPYGSNMD